MMLKLRYDESGPRHYLDDQPVHAGTRLEYMTESREWKTARYEWSYREESAPYLVTNTEKGTVVVIDEWTELRWPE